eukprot:scaffold16079_cov125-Isochrysis_galbana.AAC.1
MASPSPTLALADPRGRPLFQSPAPPAVLSPQPLVVFITPHASTSRVTGKIKGVRGLNTINNHVIQLKVKAESRHARATGEAILVPQAKRFLALYLSRSSTWTVALVDPLMVARAGGLRA